MGWAERGSPGSEEVNLEREKQLMMESRPGEGRGDNRARGPSAVLWKTLIPAQVKNPSCRILKRLRPLQFLFPRW